MYTSSINHVSAATQEVRAARKVCDHVLYQLAGLLIMSGLADSQIRKPVDDTSTLSASLASLNDLSRDNPKWSDWKSKGQELLNSKKPDNRHCIKRPEKSVACFS